jgi:hypothetical protein
MAVVVDTVRMREQGTSGLRRDAPPGISVTGLSFGIGAVWGLLGYSILWEGTPVQVDRPFVQSVAGTLVLLPVRTVLWAIRLAEDVAGRPFDLSSTHWWIAPAAGAVGAVALAGLAWAVRAVVRRRRAGARAAVNRP